MSHVANVMAVSTAVAEDPPQARPIEVRTEGRWYALDLLRFLAVVMMVQGHTFTALLGPIGRQEGWFRYHNYMHGFTAPMFFFGSGLAFGVTTLKKWDDHSKLGKAVYKRLFRYFWLLVLGYALHLPNLSLSRIFTASGPYLRDFVQVDALHHIAVVLSSFELLAVALKTKQRFLLTIGIIGAVAVLGAPIVWGLPLESWMPISLAAYFQGATGSIFPVFPWAGFVVAGVLTAQWFLRQRENANAYPVPNRRTQARWLALLGVTLIVQPIVLSRLPWSFYGQHDFWKTNPIFFAHRLGAVVFLLAILYGWEQWQKSRAIQERPSSIVRVVGQESLFIYIVHLFALYGSPLDRGISPRIGMSLNLSEAIAVFLCIMCGAVLAAFGWSYLKKRRHLEFQALRYGFAVMMLLVAFTNK